jgi:hypothetical protein
LVLGTGLARFLCGYQGFICGALNLDAAFLILGNSLCGRALLALFGILVQESIGLILTNPTKRNAKLISQLTKAILALSSRIINKLALLTKDTLLLSQVKHSFWAVKTNL